MILAALFFYLVWTVAADPSGLPVPVQNCALVNSIPSAGGQRFDVFACEPGAIMLQPEGQRAQISDCIRGGQAESGGRTFDVFLCNENVVVLLPDAADGERAV